MSSIVLADRVQETSTTTGTGTLDLDGAVTGYQGFVAGAGDTSYIPYTIVGQAGGGAAGEWECGYGTVTDAAPDTLSRTTVVSSSNSGSLVNFSAGTKDVFLTLHTGNVAFSGCLLGLGSDFACVYNDYAPIEWDVETEDVGGWHEGVTNPSRITIPAGVSRVRFTWQVQFESDNSDDRYVFFYKDGSIVNNVGMSSWASDIPGPTELKIGGASAAVAVAAGEYYELVIWQNGASPNLDILSKGTWFAVEKVM